MAARPAAAALAALEKLGVRLGLEPFRALLAALGGPERQLTAVLVAGTNGKGSTAALLDSIARAAGLATGLYTSPHLERVEERVRLSGAAVSADDLGAAVETVLAAAACANLPLPTYFEAVTAAAFLLFARAGVDLAVLEVGLGGRLDATNACEPRVSVITPIALDHTEWLGATLDAVAREKAGVLRPGRPAVLAAQEPTAARALREQAERVGARIVLADDVVACEAVTDRGLAGSRLSGRFAGQPAEFELALAGAHQVSNAATALATAQVLAEEGFPRIDLAAARAGLAGARWPGRLESVAAAGGGATVLLDVAHNPHGALALSRFLGRLGRSYVLLFGALADKDWAAMLPPLAVPALGTVLTRPVSPRALEPAALRTLLPAGPVDVVDEPAAALAAALARARSADAELVVVTGSIYLVGAVRAELRRLWGRPAAL